MLVLSRREGEKILIDQDIELVIIELRGNQVKIGIAAPKEVEIVRTELLDDFQSAAPQITPQNRGKHFKRPVLGLKKGSKQR